MPRDLTEAEQAIVEDYKQSVAILWRNALMIAWGRSRPQESSAEDRLTRYLLAIAIFLQHGKELGTIPFLAEAWIA